MIKRRLATRTETMQNQCFTAKITFIVAVVHNSQDVTPKVTRIRSITRGRTPLGIEKRFPLVDLSAYVFQ